MHKSISFIIITNNDSKCKIENQVKSILIQNIPCFEIIISGFLEEERLNKLKKHYQSIKYIECKYLAEKGNLGSMRNKACDLSSNENLVISDDDMLFPLDWYKNICLYNEDFDVLTTSVKLPDGTRFWDKCCYMSPSNGHKILNYDESDEFIYMSGGQSWIMKKYVFDEIRWDESILIYNMNNLKSYQEGNHNEDTEYSLRVREKFKIKHFEKCTVYHDDPSYTSFGRLVFRRNCAKNNKWCEFFNFPNNVKIQFSKELLTNGFTAEAFDILRLGILTDKDFKSKYSDFFNQIESVFGNSLDNSEFTFLNYDYENILKLIKEL